VKAAALPIAWLGKMHALSGISAEIAVSDHDLHRLRLWYPPFRRRFRRIYHSQLREQSRTRERGDREPVILHVGHRAARKGQHVLVRAFTSVAARFPRWRLHLVGPPGDVAFERHLGDLIAAAGLEDRVERSGNLPGAEVAALMARAALYVQPSLEEALGLALQEALFYGCAAAGTSVGGIPELIANEKTGLLVPPGDSTALAGALERLMEDGELRRRLSEAGPEGIRERGMTAEAMVLRHRELYREVLGAR
jgi:glycosyltransferase involved in cell wall biosynthesis